MKNSHPNEWRQCTLGDLFKVKHGFAFDGKFFTSEGNYILLTPGNFHDQGGFKLKDKEKYFVGEIPEDYVLKKGDLIVAMTEQAEGLLGSSALIPSSNRFLHNQRLGLITDWRSNEIDVQFLYYLFNTHVVRSQIRASATGTKVRHTSPTRIGEVKVCIPCVTTQRKIAGILSAYDVLIENNSRRIAILEEMAQAIYREWFVNFRFPGHEEVKLVDSPLGKIPEGWEVLPVGDVVETLGGGTPSTKESEYWNNGTVTWYSPTDLTKAGAMFIGSSEKRVSSVGLRNSSAKLFPPYSVMMTSRATIGVVSISTTEACTNQGFITCVPNSRLSTLMLYFWLHEQKEKILSVASGATFKEISRGTFRKLPVIVPPLPTRQAFDDAAAPIAKAIENLLKKQGNLRITRDLLLAKLISGQLDVEELDIDIGEPLAEAEA
ncbi:MAG: restriction endonuclease subunit S [Hyphomicrobiaceae bacterium]|nr:MAG: restriction endonuclease subunit S [Hyphomicrobiaceae bacterium]